MKRFIFVLLFLTLSFCGYAQTRPDYLQIKNSPVRSVKEFGATVTSSTLQQAIDSCATSSSILVIPAGTYTLTADTFIADEQVPAGNVTKTCLLMRSGMHIVGIGSVTLKLANSQSTLATPKRLYMFASNQVLNNITFDNITFDMNGANNKISPSAPLAYNLFNQAHIAFSGTPGGVAAAGNDILIKNCRFINTAGVSCIVMAQSNTVGVTLGKNWRIENCQFLNNGLDTVDHSSIYAWADNVVVTGCHFENDTMFGPPGAQVAYEFHGSNQWFENNYISNYRQAAWLATNRTENCFGQWFINNRCYTKAIGLACCVASATSRLIEARIDGNIFVISDDADPEQMKAAFICAPVAGVSNVSFTNNSVIKHTTTTSTAVAEITSSALIAGEAITRLDISNNKGYGVTFGTRVIDSGLGDIGEVSVLNNVWYGLSGNALFTTTMGVGTSGVIDKLTIMGNTSLGYHDATLAVGSHLTGSFTQLIYDSNYVSPGIEEVSFVAADIASFTGQHSFLPYDELLFSGSTQATIGNGSSYGLASIQGDMVTVSTVFVVGSTTTIGTDTLYISVPYEIDGSNMPFLGSMKIYDATDGSLKIGASVAATGSRFYGQYDSGSISGTYPITLAAGDSITAQITYKRK